MGAPSRYLTPIAAAAEDGAGLAGGKAVHLARVAAAGLATPPGLCLTTSAYRRFVEAGGLARVLSMELDRKAASETRWEELWDSALRIRTRFLATPVPNDVADAIVTGLRNLRSQGDGASEPPIAVRSSAPMEDQAGASFAGLHESVVGSRTDAEVLDAVRIVWASLWSDAALLYRAELGLDPRQSTMAVVIQLVVTRPVSGVAFGRDPRAPELDRWIVEAVPGPCAGLVDGAVDPDRWVVDRTSGQILETHRGHREALPAGDTAPLLDRGALARIGETLAHLETAFGWVPDMEWTGTAEDLVVLQARPVTHGRAADRSTDPRAQYLGLCPRDGQLATLRREVEETLIPALATEGEALAGTNLEDATDGQLGDAIAHRLRRIEHWRGIYRDRFIPFAHGVRRFGIVYNDLLKPEDPFAFVRLLEGQRLRAANRNDAILELAARVRGNAPLAHCLREGATSWSELAARCRSQPGGARFADDLEQMLSTELDVVYAGERLANRPDLLLSVVLATAAAAESRVAGPRGEADRARLEASFLAAAATANRAEQAREALATGRTAWRLRDDDNLLLGRLEAELLRALEIAARRLAATGRLDGEHLTPGESDTAALCEALRGSTGSVRLKAPDEKARPHSGTAAGSAPSSRQLMGEPASPGVATGPIRLVDCADDLGRVQMGDVLVCDAIQPMMTHVIPLAAAVVERRGGMLIHGAIIARELGVPCVTGISNALERMPAGEIATVDGHLGIVTIGATDFDLEDRRAPTMRGSQPTDASGANG